VAGFCTNFVTGLALGLLAAWARDGLHLSSDARNFFSSCYSFLKGLSQFASGHVSGAASCSSPTRLDTNRAEGASGEKGDPGEWKK
jgi:hypothetical protein